MGLFSSESRTSKENCDPRDMKLGDGSTTGEMIPLGPRRMSLCSRYFAELFIPPFRALEANGNVIDIPATFSRPRPLYFTVTVKLILLGWAMTTVALGFRETDFDNNFGYYFYGLDHWTLLLTILYHSCSLYLLIRPVNVANTNEVTVLVKFVWKLFAIIAPSQLLVTALFWTAEFDGDVSKITYDTWTVRGGLFLIAILLEGFVLHRMPIRISQHWYFFGYILIYVLWSFLREFFFLESPPMEVGYLDWREFPEGVAFVAAVVILVFVPFLFMLIWIVSLFSCCNFQGTHRRYLRIGEANQRLIDDEA